MDIGIIAHIILQVILLLVWSHTIVNAIRFRKTLPLNMFGLILTAGVLMVYILTTNLALYNHKEDALIWSRIEWYLFDIITAVIINQVMYVSKRINKYLNWFAKR